MQSSPNREQPELPAAPSPQWMVLSLLVSVVFDLVPRTWEGWIPEMTLMTLSFWALHTPQWCGMQVALFVGILLDIGRGAVLGVNALALIWCVWGVQRWRSRILWFGSFGQAMHLILLWWIVLLLEAAVHVLLLKGGWQLERLTSSALVMGLIWPLWQAILALPQRYEKGG